MAKEVKKDPNELSVEEKLKALYQLQTMLSEIDKIKTLRGELPLEVQDLEDEVTGLSTRIDKIKAEIEELKSNVASKKIEIETAKTSIEKYKSQQDNVRNNREYDVLTKEIEFQSLEVELCEKRIREFTASIKAKEEEIVKSTQMLEERKKDLEVKKNELDEIISETKAEEEKLREKPRIWKRPLSRVCYRLSNVSVKIHATVWVSHTYSVTPVVVASTRFRLRSSWISACVRKSSYANIADVS